MHKIIGLFHQKSLAPPLLCWFVIYHNINSTVISSIQGKLQKGIGRKKNGTDLISSFDGIDIREFKQHAYKFNFQLTFHQPSTLYKNQCFVFKKVKMDEVPNDLEEL